MGDRGVLLISKSLAGVFALVIVALFLAEGLLIGLLNTPECDTVPVNPAADTTKAPPVTTEKTTPATTAKTTTTAKPDTGLWTNYRLPTSLTPSTYEVDLRPVFDEFNNTYWFYGSSKVVFTCDEPTEFVLLNSRDIEYDADFELTKVSTGGAVPIKSQMFYRPNEYLVLELNTPCDKGESYQFHAPSFYGELGTDLDGLYRSEYINAANESRVIATSQMETTGARMTFPCFDEPAFKAKFTITLRHTDEYIAVSNMGVVSNTSYTEDDGSTWLKTTFEESPIMSTYLLALTVTDFGKITTKTSKDVETSIYARKSLIDNGDMDYTSVVSPLIIDVYDAHFNVFYPLTKSDQMCVPDFGAGAMENWGLVIYREYYLIYNDVISSPSNKYSVTSVIAHELAHQWFGNLVTCSYWNEIWLNEGFATYFSYVGTDGVQGTWKSWELFVTDELQPALSSDSYSSSHPLVHPEGYFSTISYSKGGSFLRMVNEFLGESTFTNGLSNYLTDHSYDVVSHDDLFAAWIDQAETDSKTYPYDLQNVFESWTLQMGYPLITVRKTGNNVYMTQSYFLVDPEDSPVETEHSDLYKYKWYVPITYKTQSKIDGTTHERAWMNLDDTLQIGVTEGDDYVLINVDSKGFYRVKYEGDLWTNIKAAVIADLNKFSAQNRAQFLDDAFEISKSGKLNIEEVLDLSMYLANEGDYIPWTTYYSGIGYYDNMLSSSSIYGDFTEYVLGLAIPLYTTMGWTDSSTDDTALIERLTRSVAVDITCFYKHPDCVDVAKSQYAAWMANPTNLISSTYRTDVYCTAIRAGGMAEWDFAWDQYLATNSDQHKSSLRFGLSCSQDPWIINRYLERVLDTNNVRLQDSSSTLSYIGRHENSKYVAWAWAANNWERLTNAVGNSAASSLLSAAVGRFSTSYDLQLVDDMLEVAGPIWTGTFNSYKARIETNMKWRENNEHKIADWLSSSSYVAPGPETFKIKNPTPRSSVPPQTDTPFPKKRMFEKLQY